MRIFFVSTFVGTFLRQRGATRSARTASRTERPRGDAVASVFMDRMLGVASVLVMASWAGARARPGQQLDHRGSLAAAAAACALTLVVIFSPRAGAAASVLMPACPRCCGCRTTGARVRSPVRAYQGASRTSFSAPCGPGPADRPGLLSWTRSRHRATMSVYFAFIR